MGEPGGLRRAAVRGAFASTLGQSLRIPIQLASIVVLARLLTPNDYGLVAMVTAVIGFADIVRDLGLSTAAVRTVDLTPAQRANLFWLNTGIGGLLTLLVMALAPVLASVYGRPEIVGITLLLAPGFLISGISTQYRVDLTRRLQFHRIALLDVISLAATVAGSIAMALLHCSYWALVIPQLIVGPLTVLALVRMNGWLPAWYDRSCDIRPFLRLGLAYLFGGLLAYASKSLDIMILGHRFGTEATGLYNRGTQIVRIPFSQLQAPFGTVLLPVLSRAADRGNLALVNAVSNAQLAFAYPIAFGAAVIAAVPNDVIIVTLGMQWTEAAWVVRLMILTVLFQAVAYPAIWVFNAQGRARVIVQFNLIAASISIPAIVIGAFWGPNGVAAGCLATAVIGEGLCLWFLKFRADVPVRALAWSAMRILVLAALGTSGAMVAAAIMGPSVGTPDAIGRLALAVIAAATVWALAQSVPAFRRDFRAILTLLGELRRR